MHLFNVPDQVLLPAERLVARGTSQRLNSQVNRPQVVLHVLLFGEYFPAGRTFLHVQSFVKCVDVPGQAVWRELLPTDRALTGLSLVFIYTLACRI